MRHSLTTSFQVVVVDEVYIRKPNSVKTYDMRITPSESPQVQLFRVCKQIKQEARELYLSKNLFVILAGPWVKPPRFWQSKAEKKLVRRLSISLDYRDKSGHVNDEWLQRSGVAQIDACAAEMPPPTSQVDEHAVHDAHRNSLMQAMWYVLFVMLKTLELDLLQINLQNCYCPWGCHRLATVALDNLPGFSNTAFPPSIRALLRNLAPKALDILGTLSKQERDIIRDCLESEGLRSKLVFHGDGSTVDADGYRVWNSTIEPADDSMDNASDDSTETSSDASSDEADEDHSDDGEGFEAEAEVEGE